MSIIEGRWEKLRRNFAGAVTWNRGLLWRLASAKVSWNGSPFYPRERVRVNVAIACDPWKLWEGQFLMSNLCKNVFEAILKYGHDEDFDPIVDNHFLPTDAPAGSQEKIEVLRRRVELGQPLWHSDDRVDYSGLTGAIRPRE